MNFGGVSRDDAVVGLDIGTTKVCTVVGTGDPNGKINILGVGVVPSRGLKKGVVIDVEDTVLAIRDSVERARHMAGIDLRAAVTGVTGDHIRSSNRRGTVTVAGPESTITPDDVERVLQAASLDVPRDREIIHSLPRDFSVDGHRGVRRPIGMCGARLEVETHVVTGTASFLQNVIQCVERAGLGVESLVLEPIATSEAVTTADERELGVALIDIGGGTSDIAVFADGSIAFSDVLPVGGTHVTRDISIGLRTPLEIAERLKIERGVASPSLIPHGEALEVVTAGSGERLRLPRSVLGEIIEARMTELFEMARDRLWAAGVQKRLPAGIILTGGGALLPGALELAGQVFGMPVRLGRPIELSGWSEQVEAPQFATAVGLLRFALRQRAAMASGTAPANASTDNESPRRVWSNPTPNGSAATPPASGATASSTAATSATTASTAVPASTSPAINSGAASRATLPTSDVPEFRPSTPPNSRVAPLTPRPTDNGAAPTPFDRVTPTEGGANGAGTKKGETATTGAATTGASSEAPAATTAFPSLKSLASGADAPAKTTPALTLVPPSDDTESERTRPAERAPRPSSIASTLTPSPLTVPDNQEPSASGGSWWSNLVARVLSAIGFRNS